MKPKVLKALQGSIKKWEGIVIGKVPDRGNNNCPLCKMFIDRPQAVDCTGCPVAEKVGADFCEQTPYREWRNAEHIARIAGSSPAKAEFALSGDQILAARKELDFLRSLLPAKLRIKYPR